MGLYFNSKGLILNRHHVHVTLRCFMQPVVILMRTLNHGITRKDNSLSFLVRNLLVTTFLQIIEIFISVARISYIAYFMLHNT